MEAGAGDPERSLTHRYREKHQRIITERHPSALETTMISSIYLGTQTRDSERLHQEMWGQGESCEAKEQGQGVYQMVGSIPREGHVYMIYTSRPSFRR